jgi:hypothetical protein
MPFLPQETPRDQPFSSMQEVLSRIASSNTSIEESEFYELSILDTPHQLGTQYVVRQAHAKWSEIDAQIMWDEEEEERFWISNEAKQRYVERRLVLVEKGFIYSDMEI